MRSTEPPDPQSLPVHSDEWWAAVYERYAPAARRGAMSVFDRSEHMRDAHDVDDIVHDVFEKLMESNSIDNNTKNIPGVLYIRARQRALDRAKRGRRTQLGDPEDQGALDLGFEGVEETDLEQRIGAHAWDNLHLLNPTERRVWSLARDTSLSQAEIAALAGISESHVSNLLKRDIPKKLLRGFKY